VHANENTVLWILCVCFFMKTVSLGAGVTAVWLSPSFFSAASQLR